MKILMENINVLYAAVMLILSAANVIVYGSGYAYKPHCYELFVVVCIVVCVLGAVMFIKNRKRQTRLSRGFGMVMPVIVFVYYYSLMFGFEWNTIYIKHSLTYLWILFTIAEITAGIIFFGCVSKKWIKITSGILAGIAAVISGFVMFIAILFDNFGLITTTEKVSPDGSYCAVFVQSDEGALGGSTSVRVRKLDSEIKLPGGVFKKDDEDIWHGSWDASPVIEWADNDTLIIDGMEYEVAQ